MNCKYCGSELLSNSNFCVKCEKNNIESDIKETKTKSKVLQQQHLNFFLLINNSFIELFTMRIIRIIM